MNIHPTHTMSFHLPLAGAFILLVINRYIAEKPIIIAKMFFQVSDSPGNKQKEKEC